MAKKPDRWFGKSNWIHGIGPLGPFIFHVPPPKEASEQCRSPTSDVVLSWIGQDIIDDLDRLDKGGDRYERINLALRVWRTFPVDVFDIGCRELTNPSGPAAQGVYKMLSMLHERATACLMVEADRFGLDPAPLAECARVKVELYAGEPWRYYGGRIAAWPDCIGEALDSLPASKQDAIREAEKVLSRLEIKWQVELQKEAQEGVSPADHEEASHEAGTGTAAERASWGVPAPRSSSPKKSKGKTLNGKTRGFLSPDDEAKVLEKCRRRCCVCYVLDHNVSEKKGQLAHLDHNRSNNAISNFVFLCLSHHDTYDSKASQAKNLTEREVGLYQAKLHEAVERGEVPGQAPTALKFPAQQAGPVSIKGDGNVVAGGDVKYVVNMPKARRGKARSGSVRPPIIPGTVSEDARMVGYLNYLVRRYEKFKKWECDRTGKRMGWGVIRNAYKRDIKYELIHTPKALFEQGVRYLQRRIENTRLGRTKQGQKLYSTFEDFDERTSDNESLPAQE